MIPAEKWGPLSDQLIGVILGAKNDERMPNTLANTVLLHMKNRTIATKSGLTALVEASILKKKKKTVVALGEMQLLKVAEQIIAQQVAETVT